MIPVELVPERLHQGESGSGTVGHRDGTVTFFQGVPGGFALRPELSVPISAIGETRDGAILLAAAGTFGWQRFHGTDQAAQADNAQKAATRNAAVPVTIAPVEKADFPVLRHRAGF